ncbi:MAG: DUF1559 domain-containing protein [Planctomycetes bacterium]|nr:DUF1559 domain-containing protein [Planctomycetota bacterium]
MRAKWLVVVVPVLLVGALGAAPLPKDEKPPAVTAAHRTASAKNLRQIGIGMHSYADHNKEKWADDITDKAGRPLLSWRVAILPYLDEEKLYKQFKLDEPWDSANNKKLIAKMPKVYAPIRVKAKEGETYYQRFVGKGALFNEKGVAYTLPQIPDGTSNTALVVEAGTPVVWSQPGDIPFNAKAPLPGLGGLFDGDFHTLLCDGSVYLFKKNPNDVEMKKVIMPDDGMVIDIDKLTK